MGHLPFNLKRPNSPAIKDAEPSIFFTPMAAYIALSAVMRLLLHLTSISFPTPVNSGATAGVSINAHQMMSKGDILLVAALAFVEDSLRRGASVIMA